MSAGLVVPRSLQPLVRPQVILIVGLAAAAGVLVAVSNSLMLQLAAIGALTVLLIALALTRAGVVLNAVWPIVAWLYLLGPIGSGAALLGFDLSPGVVVLLGIAPFPIFAAVARPRILWALAQLLPIAVLAAIAILSLAWSSDPAYGMSKLALWLTTCILPAAFIVMLARATTVSWRFIAGIGFAYAVILILFGADTATYPGRATIFGANPIWIARAAVIVSIVGVFGPFKPRTRLLLLVTGTVGALMTGSLGPLAGLVAGILAGAAVEVRRRGWGDWRTLVAMICLLGVAAMLLVVVTLGLLDPAVDDALRDPNNLSRGTFLGVAARLFSASPLIGTGFGGFASTGLDVYPHNLVAEVASELGLLGLLALAAWILVVLRASIRSALFTALIVTTFVFSMFSGSIAGNAEFWFFSALAVGVVPMTGLSLKSSGSSRTLFTELASIDPPALRSRLGPGWDGSSR
jgi:branched-subunit amino acid transport protein AzlD